MKAFLVLVLMLATTSIQASPSPAVPDRTKRLIVSSVPRARDLPPLCAVVLTVSPGSYDADSGLVHEHTFVVVQHIDPRADRPRFDPTIPYAFALVDARSTVRPGDIVALERLPVPATFSYQTNPDKPANSRPVEYSATVITGHVALE